MNKRWKQIRHSKDYWVSTDGELGTMHRGFFKVLRPALNTSGYYSFASKEKKRLDVHREVAKAFVPGYKEELVVNHKDGCKTNNIPSNLEWVTPMQNTRHWLNNKRHAGAYLFKSSGVKFKKFHSQIMVSGTRVSLGYYASLEEAQDVFSQTYREFFGIVPLMETKEEWWQKYK